MLAHHDILDPSICWLLVVAWLGRGATVATTSVYGHSQTRSDDWCRRVDQTWCDRTLKGSLKSSLAAGPVDEQGCCHSPASMLWFQRRIVGACAC